MDGPPSDGILLRNQKGDGMTIRSITVSLNTTASVEYRRALSPSGYEVVSLVNLLEPAVGDIVSRDQLQMLIDDGVEVNIQ